MPMNSNENNLTLLPEMKMLMRTQAAKGAACKARHSTTCEALKEALLPLKTERIYKGESIYIETADRRIFRTGDSLLFDLIGNGTVIGVFRHLLVYRNSSIFMYDGKRHVRMLFYMAEGRIEYKDETGRDISVQGGRIVDATSSNRDIGVFLDDRNTERNVLAVYYANYVVVAISSSVVFISLKTGKEIHFCFSSDILELSVCALKTVKCLCTRTESRQHLFYGTVMLSGAFDGFHVLPSGFILSDLELLFFRGLSRPDRAKLLNQERLAEKVLKQALNREMHRTETIEYFVMLLDSLSTKAVKLTPDGDYTQTSGHFDCCAMTSHRTIGRELVTATEDLLGKMSGLLTVDLFYENPAEYSSLLGRPFDMAEFLSRQYSRLFYYDRPAIKGKNLAYRTIRTMKRQSKRVRATGMDKYLAMAASLPSNTVSRLLHKLYGDSRCEEILALITEASITIEADVDDVASTRQKAFLVRLGACAGTFLLYTRYLTYRPSTQIRLNDKAIEEMLTEDAIFMFYACNHFASLSDTGQWKQLRNRKAVQYGRLFGTGLASGLTDKKYNEIASNLSRVEETKQSARYALLILATSSEQSPQRDMSRYKLDTQDALSIQGSQERSSPLPVGAGQFDKQKARPPMDSSIYRTIYQRTCSEQPERVYKTKINDIFIAHLLHKEISIKKAAVASLGIYNLESQNSGLFSRLVAECKRHGPLDSEKTVQFYDRPYRILAALSASLISNTRSPVETGDTFADLIINGMSFIQTGLYANLFYRPDICRPDEVFYSVLFSLLNSFSMAIPDVLAQVESVDLKTATSQSVHRMAAEMFYVGLKGIREQGTDGGVIASGYRDRILRFIERLESLDQFDDKFVILFDFSLVSLSIILCGTFDLQLLRIIRRRILSTKRLQDVHEHSVYSPAAKGLAVCHFSGYESMLYYKLCAGLVCCGLGTKKLFLRGNITYKLLITAFLYTANPLLKFDYFDPLRLLLIRTLKDDSIGIERTRKAMKRLQTGRYRRRNTRWFWAKFENLSQVNKKFTVDVLSDFLENGKSSSALRGLFDMRLLARLLAITK